MGILENFFFFPLALAVCLRGLLTLFAICYLIHWFGCGHRHHLAFDEDPE